MLDAVKAFDAQNTTAPGNAPATSSGLAQGTSFEGGGGSGPPAFTPSLDFSDARNSQYFGLLGGI